VFQIEFDGNEGFGMFDVVVDLGLAIPRPITVDPVKTRPK